MTVSGDQSVGLVNDHFHDDASADAAAPLIAHCRAALECGVTSLCVTNHVEIPDGDGGWRVDLAEASERFRGELEAVGEARRAFPDLDVRLGAEFEYRPEWTEPLERLAGAVPFDLVLGSVHVVDGLNVSGGSEPERYFEGRDCRAAYRAYFESVERMVLWGGFDVVAHFDLVKRFGHLHCGPYDPSDFESTIRRILRRMATAGIGLEINTSGAVQPPGVPYPEAEILAWAREEGVSHLTIGTDSHAPGRIDQGLAEGLALARRAGWDKLTRFERRQPVDLRLASIRSAGDTSGARSAGRSNAADRRGKA
jgi:histidinol-phosphatase (PHP family)